MVAYTECMQYTLRNVPPRVDALLRERAKRESKSLNEVVIDALTHVLGLEEDAPPAYRKLDDMAETWVHDEATEAALGEQRSIDPSLWD